MTFQIPTLFFVIVVSFITVTIFFILGSLLSSYCMLTIVLYDFIIGLSKIQCWGDKQITKGSTVLWNVYCCLQPYENDGIWLLLSYKKWHSFRLDLPNPTVRWFRPRSHPPRASGAETGTVRRAWTWQWVGPGFCADTGLVTLNSGQLFWAQLSQR